jgi:uncharacterized membrane protein (TIGR02234 family)
MRTPTIAFALLVGGAAAMVITAAVPWYEANGIVSFSGTDSTGGLAQALSVAILAGALLMLTLRSTGRRIVAGVVAAIGVLAACALPWRRPSRAEVVAELRKQTLTDSFQLSLTGGSIGYALAALLVVSGAVLVLLRAQRWPGRADRFKRPTDSAAESADQRDPAAIWKAIDAGHDPTAGPD